VNSQSISCRSRCCLRWRSGERWRHWVEDNANAKKRFQLKERSRILVFLDTSLSSPGKESHGCSYSFCYKLPLRVGIFGSPCYQNKTMK